jgi:hypothetical protein
MAQMVERLLSKCKAPSSNQHCQKNGREGGRKEGRKEEL